MAYLPSALGEDDKIIKQGIADRERFRDTYVADLEGQQDTLLGRNERLNDYKTGSSEVQGMIKKDTLATTREIADIEKQIASGDAPTITMPDGTSSYLATLGKREITTPATITKKYETQKPDAYYGINPSTGVQFTAKEVEAKVMLDNMRKAEERQAMLERATEITKRAMANPVGKWDTERRAVKLAIGTAGGRRTGGGETLGKEQQAGRAAPLVYGGSSKDRPLNKYTSEEVVQTFEALEKGAETLNPRQWELLEAYNKYAPSPSGKMNKLLADRELEKKAIDEDIRLASGKWTSMGDVDSTLKDFNSKYKNATDYVQKRVGESVRDDRIYSGLQSAERNREEVSQRLGAEERSEKRQIRAEDRQEAKLDTRAQKGRTTEFVLNKKDFSEWLKSKNPEMSKEQIDAKVKEAEASNADTGDSEDYAGFKAVSSHHKLDDNGRDSRYVTVSEADERQQKDIAKIRGAMDATLLANEGRMPKAVAEVIEELPLTIENYQKMSESDNGETSVQLPTFNASTLAETLSERLQEAESSEGLAVILNEITEDAGAEDGASRARMSVQILEAFKNKQMDTVYKLADEARQEAGVEFEGVLKSADFSQTMQDQAKSKKFKTMAFGTDDPTAIGDMNTENAMARYYANMLGDPDNKTLREYLYRAFDEPEKYGTPRTRAMQAQFASAFHAETVTDQQYLKDKSEALAKYRQNNPFTPTSTSDASLDLVAVYSDDGKEVKGITNTPRVKEAYENVRKINNKEKLDDFNTIFPLRNGVYGERTSDARYDDARDRIGSAYLSGNQIAIDEVMLDSIGGDNTTYGKNITTKANEKYTDLVKKLPAKADDDAISLDKLPFTSGRGEAGKYLAIANDIKRDRLTRENALKAAVVVGYQEAVSSTDTEASRELIMPLQDIYPERIQTLSGLQSESATYIAEANNESDDILARIAVDPEYAKTYVEIMRDKDYAGNDSLAGALPSLKGRYENLFKETQDTIDKYRNLGQMQKAEELQQELDYAKKTVLPIGYDEGEEEKEKRAIPRPKQANPFPFGK